MKIRKRCAKRRGCSSLVVVRDRKVAVDKDGGQLLSVELLVVRGRLLSQVEGVVLVGLTELEARLELALGGPTGAWVDLGHHLLAERLLLLLLSLSVVRGGFLDVKLLRLEVHLVEHNHHRLGQLLSLVIIARLLQMCVRCASVRVKCE